GQPAGAPLASGAHRRHQPPRLVPRTLRYAQGGTATLDRVSDGLLLAIDVGNTNVKLGTFDGDRLTANWRLETDATRTPDEYAILLDWLLRRRGLGFDDIAGVSLSSTVPAMVPLLREVVANYCSTNCNLGEVSS